MLASAPSPRKTATTSSPSPRKTASGGESPEGRASLQRGFKPPAKPDVELGDAATAAVDAIVGVFDKDLAIDEPAPAKGGAEAGPEPRRAARESGAALARAAADEMRDGPTPAELAAAELLVPPSFGFPEVEMAQESFVRQFRGGTRARRARRRRLLARSSSARFGRRSDERSSLGARSTRGRLFRTARARRAHVEATVHRCVAGQFAFRRDPGDGGGAFAQPRGIPPKELDALRKKLTERSVVRFVGLVCHLLYWSVLRPEFEGLAPPGGAAAAGPSDKEREALFTEVLSCHAQIHAEMRSSSKHVDTVLAPVLHLALRCAIERLSARKSTAGSGRADQTLKFSSSVTSTSIRLMFGRSDRSRRALEARPKSLVRTVR